MTEIACLVGDVQIIPGNTLYATVTLNLREADGTRWYLTDAEGWWTLPSPNLLDIPRPQKQDGSYDVEGNYLARLVTISGIFIPGSKSMTPAKRSILLRACDSMRGAPVQLVFNENPPKMAYARLVDIPQISSTKPTGETEFVLPFKCVDPRKYSLAVSTGSVGAFTSAGIGRTYNRSYPRDYLDVTVAPIPVEVYAVNAGSVSTPPTIVLTGPLADPEILNFTTGDSLSFPGLMIQDGETMTIDVAEHTAIVGTDGQRTSYLAYDSVWWWLSVGTNAIRLIANDGFGGPAAGSMTFTWRSAWME